MIKSTEPRGSKQADAAFAELLADLHDYQENTAAEEEILNSEKDVDDACKAYARKKAAKKRAKSYAQPYARDIHSDAAGQR